LGTSFDEIILVNFLKGLFGSGSTRRITLSNPLIIRSPRLGLLNLMGSSAEAILKEDKAALSSLFSSIEHSDLNPPACDVLLIYGHIEKDGHFANYSERLRDIIRKSNAPIVIVASENDTQNYIAAGKRTGYGQANLIMTLERKTTAFTSFFSQLFEMMYKGKSMLVAWVELAPQIPGATHDNCPETIFSAEISHIIFERA
jgi:hypothetical protein